MELKHLVSFSFYFHLDLLIVPYGIETFFFFQALHLVELLIVPYGIETTLKA